MVSAIVLAAGRSRRMGRFKPLLPFGDRTVVERVVDALLAVPVDRVLVVVSEERADEIRRALGGRAVTYTANPDPDAGMLSSVQTGLRALGGGVDHAMVCLVDQPGVPTEAYRALLEGAAGSGRPAAPQFMGRLGHPVLIPRSLFPEVLALDPRTQSLKDLVRRHEPELLRVPVDSDAVLHDIDDPESYARELSRLPDRRTAS